MDLSPFLGEIFVQANLCEHDMPGDSNSWPFDPRSLEFSPHISNPINNNPKLGLNEDHGKKGGENQ